MRNCCLALLLGVPLVFFSNQYPEWGNPNIASRLYLTLALVDFGSLSLDPVLERAGISPSELQDKATHAGRHYTDKPPMISLLLTPIAWLLRQVTTDLSDKEMFWWLRLIGLGLPTLVFWLAFRRHARELTESDDLADAVTLAGALGTNFFIYATQFFAHVPAGICLFASYWLVLAACSDQPVASHRRVLSAGGAGLVAAVAVTSDYIVAFAVIALASGLVFASPQRWRSALGFALGAAGPLVAWMAYNQLCFGSPLRTGFQAHADPVFGPAYRSGLFGLRPPDPAALAGLLFLPQRGEFFLSPFLLLAGWGWYRLVDDPRRRLAGWLSLAAFLGVLAFALLTIQWRGGWAVGSRYLVPSVPMLLVGVAGCFVTGGARPAFEEWLTRILFAAGALVGLFWIAVAAASFPAFPDDFQNPLRHFALALLFEGRANPNLAQPVLGDAGSVLAFGAWMALAALVLLARSLGELGKRAWPAGGAAVVLAAIVALAQASIPEPAGHAEERGLMYTSIVTIMGYDTPLGARRAARKRLDAGDYAGAAALYERLSDSDSQDPADYLNLAVALEKLGQVDAALERARRAASQFPGDWRGHYLVGSMLQVKGAFADAAAAYGKALELSPTNPEIPRRIEQCKAQTRP